MEDTLSRDPTQKIFEYIALLENTNEELVKTLNGWGQSTRHK